MTVTAADLSIAFRSGEVPALATPRIVALLEEATLAALDAAIRAGDDKKAICAALEAHKASLAQLEQRLRETRSAKLDD